MKNETKIKSAADYIVPLSINGLNGRAMHIKSTQKQRKREILLVYGHHSSLERMFSIAQNLSEYGNVSLPDLPGFGGMDSFYTIGEKPTLDNMADYLATFIRLHYKKRPVTICAMSWGFLVATKMLQKYPDITKQVNMLISFVGFSKTSDFKVSSNKQTAIKIVAKTFSTAPTSAIFRYVILQPFFIKSAYKLMASRHPKMKDANKEELEKRVTFEVTLWQCNDARTYMYTNGTMFNFDLTKQKVDLPLIYISVAADQYFNNKSVAKNLRKIFKHVTVAKAHIANHAPTIVDNPEEAGAFLPESVRKMLSENPN